jgi:hypothetical protein
MRSNLAKWSWVMIVVLDSIWGPQTDRLGVAVVMKEKTGDVEDFDTVAPPRQLKTRSKRPA